MRYYRVDMLRRLLARSKLNLTLSAVTSPHHRTVYRGIGDFPIRPKNKPSQLIEIQDDKMRKQLAALAHNANPWTRVQDPKGSGEAYWWNQRTNETTALGAPRPSVWLKQMDPDGSGQSYWWNPETNETTALGVPDPSLGQLMQPQGPFSPHIQTGPPQTFGQSMKTYAVLGGAMSMAFALVGAVFR